MSIFNNIFNKKTIQPNDIEKKDKVNFEWEKLTSLEQLSKIKEISQNSIVGIFKHSTRCSISRRVLSKFEVTFNKELPIKMYYLDLLNYREISNEVAYRFQVIHQSPQLLLIEEGKIRLHASHYDIITQIDLQQFMK